MFPPAPHTHSADRHAKMLFTTHTLNLPTCKPRKLEPLAISGYGCPRKPYRPESYRPDGWVRFGSLRGSPMTSLWVGGTGRRGVLRD